MPVCLRLDNGVIHPLDIKAMNRPEPRTRIQKKNTQAILDAALGVFSQYGFRGATLDQIAQSAQLSKPNLLYYFPSKEAIHVTLLSALMDTWLDPLRALNAKGEPMDEILAYVMRKLQMSRDFPRESRLFANEVLQGAPRMLDVIRNDLRPLVDEKAAIIQSWIDAGRIAPLDPYHLLFSIWSLTQHYADFDIQVRTILAGRQPDPFVQAECHLRDLFTRMLQVSPGENISN